MLAEQARALDEERDRLLGVDQALHMGEVPARLDGKDETIGRPPRPCAKGRF